MFCGSWTSKSQPTSLMRTEVFKKPPLGDQKMLANMVCISCMLVLKKAFILNQLKLEATRRPRRAHKQTNKPGVVRKTLWGQALIPYVKPQVQAHKGNSYRIVRQPTTGGSKNC